MAKTNEPGDQTPLESEIAEIVRSERNRARRSKRLAQKRILETEAATNEIHPVWEAIDRVYRWSHTAIPEDQFSASMHSEKMDDMRRAILLASMYHQPEDGQYELLNQLFIIAGRYFFPEDLK